MSILIEDSVNMNIPGRWNRAIITPEWLRMQFPEWFPETKYELVTLRTLPILPIGFRLEKVQVEPSDDRIVLKPVGMEEDRLDFVAKLATAICSTLNHTPILAVGHNVHFQLEEGECFAFDQFADGDAVTRFYGELGLGNMRSNYTHLFSLEDHRLQITYNEGSDPHELAFNFHYETRLREKIESAITAFKDNVQHARELADRLVRRDT